jgi:hypothetical protein
MLRKISNKLLKRLSAFFILIGALVRFRQYFHNKSLWLDEAMLALNIINRNYEQLLQTLDYQQMAPPAFLWVSKLLGSWQGYTEWGLRLWPFVASLLALLLLWQLMKSLSASAAEQLAVIVLFACSFRLSYYAGEFKQYSSDVFWVMLCLLLGVKADLLQSWRKAGLLLLAGAVGLWFSHPLIFVLAGIGLYQLWQWQLQRKPADLLPLAIVGGGWLMSLGIQYVFILAKDTNRAAMQDYWKDAFLPVPPHGKAELEAWLDIPQQLFYSTLGINSIGWLLMFIVLAGGILLWEQKRYWVMALLLPLPLIIVASVLKIYPFSSRLLLFLTPPTAVLTGMGIVAIIRRLNHPVITLLLVLLVFVQPVALTTLHIFQPIEKEEIKPLLRYYEQNARADDVLYIYYGAGNAAKYYEAIGFAKLPGRVIYGNFDRNNPLRGIAQDVSQLPMAESRRIWVLFSHILNKEDFYTRELLGSYKDGKLMQTATGAELYLFE